MATPPQAIKKLGRFLAYVLGRHPDEFGLIPDNQGYIAVKDLLKALHHEEGWRHLRMSHLHQLTVMVQPCPIELEEKTVRATGRDRLPDMVIPEQLPKLLYMAIRRRAYPAALANGLAAGNRPFLILSSDRAMAFKIGRRQDHHPVMLTIQVAHSLAKGTRYHQYGETLYLADTLAIGTFSGPALPKEKEAAAAKTPDKAPAMPKTAGSYLPDISISPEERRALKRERRQRKKAQEKARRQARKNKSRRPI